MDSISLLTKKIEQEQKQIAEHQNHMQLIQSELKDSWGSFKVQLQQELVDTEDKIQASRRFYNGGVRDLNTKIQTFPVNIVAGMFGFQSKEFFEVEDRASVENPVEVQF